MDLFKAALALEWIYLRQHLPLDWIYLHVLVFFATGRGCRCVLFIIIYYYIILFLTCTVLFIIIHYYIILFLTCICVLCVHTTGRGCRCCLAWRYARPMIISRLGPYHHHFILRLCWQPCTRVWLSLSWLKKSKVTFNSLLCCVCVRFDAVPRPPVVRCVCGQTMLYTFFGLVRKIANIWML